MHFQTNLLLETVLEETCGQSRPPILVYGEPGTGRLHHLLLQVNRENQDSVLLEKIRKRKTPDLVVLDGNHIDKEDMREGLREIRRGPVELDRKHLILRNMEMCRKDVLDQALKVMERPRKYLSIGVTCRRLDLIPPAIHSRCWIFRHPRLDWRTVYSILSVEGESEPDYLLYTTHQAMLLRDDSWVEVYDHIFHGSGGAESVILSVSEYVRDLKKRPHSEVSQARRAVLFCEWAWWRMRKEFTGNSLFSEGACTAAEAHTPFWDWAETSSKDFRINWTQQVERYLLSLWTLGQIANDRS